MTERGHQRLEDLLDRVERLLARVAENHAGHTEEEVDTASAFTEWLVDVLLPVLADVNGVLRSRSLVLAEEESVEVGAMKGLVTEVTLRMLSEVDDEPHRLPDALLAIQLVKDSERVCVRQARDQGRRTVMIAYYDLGFLTAEVVEGILLDFVELVFHLV